MAKLKLPGYAVSSQVLERFDILSLLLFDTFVFFLKYVFQIDQVLSLSTMMDISIFRFDNTLADFNFIAIFLVTFACDHTT